MPSKAGATGFAEPLGNAVCMGDGSLIGAAAGRAAGNADGDRLALPQSVVRIVDDDAQTKN